MVLIFDSNECEIFIMYAFMVDIILRIHTPSTGSDLVSIFGGMILLSRKYFCQSVKTFILD